MAKKKKIATIKDENAISNPYKVNQYLEDPRQMLFFKLYFNSDSDSFGNCYLSAVKAGYQPSYAKNITDIMPLWLREKVEIIKTEDIINQAEKNIKEVLNLDTIQPIQNKITGEIINKIDTDLLRIKDNTSKWSLERLNKDKYSSRTEHISKNLTIIQNIEANIKEIASIKNTSTQDDKIIEVDNKASV